MTCSNCGLEMTKVDGYYAVTTLVKKDDGKILFKPDSGIPIASYVCGNCGKLELYLARDSQGNWIR